MIVIGIQGEKGSANELACLDFVRKNKIRDYEIKYLVSSENVLRELNKGKIDFSFFAVSTKLGKVKESEVAMKKYSFKKVGEINYPIVHVLLGLEKRGKEYYSCVISHPHALKMRENYLKKNWPDLKFVEEKNTATAARKLSEGKYNDNTLVLALKECAKLYGLRIVDKKMKSYYAKFYFVKKV
jgi:prephenate dehydratase